MKFQELFVFFRGDKLFLGDSHRHRNLTIQRAQNPTPRDILQFSPLRSKEQRDNALETLIEHHYIRLIKSGKKPTLNLILTANNRNPISKSCYSCYKAPIKQ